MLLQNHWHVSWMTEILKILLCFFINYLARHYRASFSVYSIMLNYSFFSVYSIMLNGSLKNTYSVSQYQD